MAQPTYTSARTFAGGYLFGIPVKDLGWFASLLIGLSTGFAMFFAGTFFGIVFILIANTAGHKTIDYAWSYSRIGLPIGVLSGIVALSYLGYLWVRRQVARR